MSTQPSPLEQLEQQTETQDTNASPKSDLSPLEQLEQQHVEPNPATQDQGFLTGLYNNTLAPIGAAAKGVYNTLTQSEGTPEQIEAQRQQAEAYKHRTYQEAGDHLKGGNFLAAAGTLMTLLSNPDDKMSAPAYAMVNNLVDLHKEQLRTAQAAYKAGNYTEAAGHAAAGLLPALGPVAAKAGEDIGEGKTGEGLGEAAGLVGTVLAPELVNKASGAIGKVASKFTPVADTTNLDLQSGIRNVAGAVADDVGVQADSPSVRTQFEKIADGVQEQSSGLYKKIDDVTDNEFTNLQKKIRNVDFKLRDIAGTDDALEEKLTNQKAELSDKLDDAIETAKAKGVDPAVADQAKAAWKQQSALRDVDTQLKASTFGNAKQAAEVVDPAKLVNRLQKLSDSGRLQEALGEEQADELLQKAYDGLKQGKETTATNAKVTANRNLAKKVAIGTAKTAGTALGLGAGAKIISGLTGGH
jgi:hypothetical protein